MEPEDIETFIQRMYDTSHNTYRLLDNLLEWARSTGGLIPFHPNNYNIVDIIHHAVDYLKPQAESKKITLLYPDLYDTEWYAQCDVNMVNAILRNLISNSIKFSFNDSSVEVFITNYNKEKDVVFIFKRKAGQK